MKLTGVCGHSCLMYCCSPHRISWMTHGRYWVFHHKFTQFFTQSVSLVSQQPHFGVVRCGPTCLIPFSGPSSLIPWCLWLKSLATSSKLSSLPEKSKRSSEVVLNTFFSSTRERYPQLEPILVDEGDVSDETFESSANFEWQMSDISSERS